MNAIRASCILAILFLSGCSSLPIKDGGLVVGKDTTATIENVEAPRVKVTRGF